jgi:multidrug transporter EmrE-like cation transporter
MTASSILLLLLAGCCHAAWNLVLKNVDGSRDWVLVWSMVFGSIVFAPSLLMPLPARCVLLAVFSALCECLYFFLLARAYDRFDVSVVYPIARGTAPVFTTAASMVLLPDRLSVPGIAGIAVIAAGIAISSGRRTATAQHWWGSGAIVTSIGIAAVIAAYTLIDAAAVKAANPVAYTELVFVFSGVLMMGLHAKREGLARGIRGLRVNWKTSLAVGVLMMAAYSLVLMAYRTSHVAYAAAVREVSIPITALAGVVLLKEPFGKVRVAGSVVIAAGILLIAFAR